jgi:ATP-binding cassette, subfamily B, bacterial MsbA
MKTYIRLIRYVKAHLWVLGLAAVFMILSSVLQPISLGGFIPFIDKVMMGQDISLPGEHVPEFIQNAVTRLNSIPRMRLLGMFIIFYVIMFVLRSIFIYCQQFLMREVSQRVVRDIRNILYEKLLRLSMNFYSHARTGTLVSRITYDTTIIQDAVAEGVTDLIWQSLQFLFSLGMVIAIAVFFRIDIRFIFIALVVMPVIVFPLIHIGKRLRQLSKKTQEFMAGLNNVLYESVSGIRVVKGYSMEEYETKKFREQNEYFKKMIMKANKRTLAVSPLTELVTMVSAMVILWLGGQQVIEGNITIGTLAVFSLSVLSLSKPINRLSRVHNVNQQALAAASRIFDTLDEKIAIEDKQDASILPPIKKDIVFNKVCFAYSGTGKDVLSEVSFQAEVGEVVAFVGPSGAGKTTLVSLISRFYDPTKGSVAIDGYDIKDIKLQSLIQQIGIVTQDTILFNDTVAANIAYGKQDSELSQIEHAARTANAHDFIMKMPEGYNTVIGEKGFKLSGGEKQRLAIARAIFKNPPILIFDEATSQLDSESEKLVQEAIDRLMQGRTVFVIAHRLSTIKHADIIIVMENGRIVDKGRHDELISKKTGLYSKLYTMQFESF